MSNRLRELRQKNNLTLEELGKKVGIPKNTLSRYENDKREPKLQTWQKLADFFNVSVPYIQGTGGETFTMDEIIEIINENYFKSLSSKSGTLGGNFVKNVNLYIRETSKNPIPSELFSETTAFGNDIKNYWLSNFKIILETDDFKSLPKHGKEFPDLTYRDGAFVLFAFKLEDVVSKLNKNKLLTSLGAFFMKDYNLEIERDHDETVEQIKYFDLSSAKRAIKKYCNDLNKLKEEINSFKPDDKYYNEYLQVILNYSKGELNSDKSKGRLKKTILNEIDARVSSGDKKLRNYLINHYDEHSEYGIISDYKNYQIKNDEDTTLVDEFIKSLN